MIILSINNLKVQSTYKNIVNYLWNLRIVRFTCGGGINLSVKLFLTAIFKKFGLPLWLNYGIVHSIVVVLSYFYHSIITFEEHKRSFRGFWKFFLSVLILKLTDYSVVIITDNISMLKHYVYNIPTYGSILGDNLLYIIIIFSSVTIYLIRYFLFKNIIFVQL